MPLCRKSQGSHNSHGQGPKALKNQSQSTTDYWHLLTFADVPQMQRLIHSMSILIHSQAQDSVPAHVGQLLGTELSEPPGTMWLEDSKGTRFTSTST